MGSWYGTCGISHLPIHHEDPVKLLIIEHSDYQAFHEHGGGFCDSSSLFRVVGPALDCKYYDYGIPFQYENNLASEWMLSFLRKTVTRRGVILDDRALEDVDGLSKDKLGEASLENLIRLIERGGVWTTSSVHHTNEPFGIFLVHKFIWDQIVKTYPAMGEPSAHRWRDHTEEFKELREFLVTYQHPERSSEEERHSWQLSSKYDQFFHRLGVHFYELLELVPESRQKAVWMFDQVLEVYAIVNFMNNVRRGIIPQFGAGSQTVEYEAHKRLASWVNDFCNSRRRNDGELDADSVPIKDMVTGSTLSSFKDDPRLAKWLQLSKELGIIKG